MISFINQIDDEVLESDENKHDEGHTQIAKKHFVARPCEVFNSPQRCTYGESSYEETTGRNFKEICHRSEDDESGVIPDVITFVYVSTAKLMKQL